MRTQALGASSRNQSSWSADSSTVTDEGCRLRASTCNRHPRAKAGDPSLPLIAWMPGSSPGMTYSEKLELRHQLRDALVVGGEIDFAPELAFDAAGFDLVMFGDLADGAEIPPLHAFRRVHEVSPAYR